MLLLYRTYVSKHSVLRLLPRRVRKSAFLLRVLVGKCYRLVCRPSRIGAMLHDSAQAVRRWIRPPFSAKAMMLAEGDEMADTALIHGSDIPVKSSAVEPNTACACSRGR